MKMSFDVDQSEAFKLGIDTPSKTVELDLDPKDFSDRERIALAYASANGNTIRFRDDGSIGGSQGGTHPIYSMHLRLIRPSIEGVHEALRETFKKVDQYVSEQREKIEAEKTSYRVMIHALENHDYFEPRVIPPTKRQSLKVTWQYAPNYSKSDPYAETLWDRYQELEELEKGRIYREKDATLIDDLRNYLFTVEGKVEIEAGAQWVNYVKESDLEKYCPNAKRLRELRIEVQQEIEKKKVEETRERIVAILREHGTPDQLERYQAGVLPREDLDEVIRKHLFAPFATLARYEPMTALEVANDLGIRVEEVKFLTREKTELTTEEFRTWKLIQTLAPPDASIRVREHVGYPEDEDEDDEDDKVTRSGIIVTRYFEGDKYTREYAVV